MLSTERRIKKESFTKILKEGSFVHSDHFYVVLLSNKELIQSQFSFVVSSKISKTSVGRHLLKRRMSKVVEEVLINVRSGWYCLFFAKKGSPSLSFSELKLEILNLIKKTKLLN